MMIMILQQALKVTRQVHGLICVITGVMLSINFIIDPVGGVDITTTITMVSVTILIGIGILLMEDR